MSTRILDLCGKWQFKEYPQTARRMRDLDEGDWLECKVPSSIYNCLIEAGLIELSNLQANPKDFINISEKAWIFQKIFDCPADIINLDKVELIFDGLDTFCQIWLNDKLIGKTDNMFCSYRYDIKSLLKEKNNRLLVKCDSALVEGNRLMQRFGMLSRDRCSFPCRAYVRKAQCQFGWDWAPPMPGCGIWQQVRIEGFRYARIKDIHIRTVEVNSENADIKISVQIENLSDKKPINCKLSIVDPDGATVIETELDFSKTNNNTTILKIKPVRLWWPNTYGQQHIYTLKAELFCDNELLETSSKNFGIRTIQVNQTPDEYGTSFQFIVNNHPVYVRGAAWIPFTLLIGSATQADYEKALTAAKDANINMLRVWGGGIYETETFYNLCDRLGIMVWQDFTFACAYYPDRKWFADIIKEEAAQNIIRLRNHPSLALWCGNNEINWMHTSGALGKGKKFYGKNIYHKILPELINELDPDRDYIHSTPLGPDKNPNDPKYGTVHQWHIWSGLEPTDNYLLQIPRFVAEFGFQALPDRKTIKNFVPKSTLHCASEELEKHDYQPNGNAKLHYYINELFRPPKNLDEFIYLSQITQARAIRKNVEHLRANSNINSGVLFWQFNDCCPSISWSCLDYLCRPKALYYYAKRLFAPILTVINAKYDSSLLPIKKDIAELTALIVNHSPDPLTGSFICQLLDTDLQLLDEYKRPVSISPNSSLSFSLPQSFSKPNNPQNNFIYLSLENDKNIITRNSFFYLPDKYINWPKAEIDIQSEKTNDRQWLLKIKSSKVIKDLYIDIPFEVKLSDNFFDLLTKEIKTITIETEEPVDELQKNISFICVNAIFSDL